MTEREFGQRMRERLENIDQRLEMLNARLERAGEARTLRTR
jgi:hypothetical protein